MNTIITISAIGLIAMMAEIFSFKKALPLLVFAGLLLALFFNFQDWNTNRSYFNCMMLFDNYAILFSSLIIQIVILWLMMSQNFFESASSITDHYAIILFSVVGAIVMTCFSNVVMFFIGLEILSISMYVLAASSKNSLRSNEAGLKYFLMGAFATGFLLFGMALLFGVTASFNLADIASYVNTNAANLPDMFYSSIILLLIGLLFKIAAVPFHWWAPDVYEGSPTPVTAFMSTVVKTAAFAAFFRLFSTCFSSVTEFWTDLLVWISALSMIVGNLIAVSQTNLKRMLAYSSIAHAGYMLMAIIACNSAGAKALLIYSYSYAAATLGAFAVLNIMSNQLKTTEVKSLTGLSTKHPQMAILLSIIMLSFAGIPPMAGFFAKYYMFYAVIDQGYIWLVILAIASSLIGVYYYLRPVITMFTTSKEINQLAFKQSDLLFMLLIVVILLFLAFAPQLLIDLL